MLWLETEMPQSSCQSAKTMDKTMRRILPTGEPLGDTLTLRIFVSRDGKCATRRKFLGQCLYLKLKVMVEGRDVRVKLWRLPGNDNPYSVEGAWNASSATGLTQSETCELGIFDSQYPQPSTNKNFEGYTDSNEPDSAGQKLDINQQHLHRHDLIKHVTLKLHPSCRIVRIISKSTERERKLSSGMRLSFIWFRKTLCGFAGGSIWD
uniref:Uncharacterized protein n=1 Tax=Ramularia collo-cygni TaxID=112498 RepID=A0A2D3UXB8_9PEZI